MGFAYRPILCESSGFWMERDCSWYEFIGTSTSSDNWALSLVEV